MKYYFCFLFYSIGLVTYAQPRVSKPVKVLFIGNSYTYYNSMPQICVGIAASMGDVLVTEQSTVGGYTLRQHVGNSNTLEKIVQGTPDYNNQKARSSWDFVVLQEHSQLPSNPKNAIERDVYPYVNKLDSTIHVYNPEAKLVFYRTWGRKNGDASRCAEWPSVCTYLGMDSLLAKTYTSLAAEHDAFLSPVGDVWKYLREHYPSLELYNADESHPSEVGSYAAACCFYTIFFKKNPSLIQYNYTLSNEDAENIRKAVKVVVFDKRVH